MASSEDIAYSVKLVAATGKEQAVLLRIRRDGLWLFTQGGKVCILPGTGYSAAISINRTAVANSSSTSGLLLHLTQP